MALEEVSVYSMGMNVASLGFRSNLKTSERVNVTFLEASDALKRDTLEISRWFRESKSANWVLVEKKTVRI